MTNFRYVDKRMVEAIQHFDKLMDDTVCVPVWYIQAMLDRQIFSRGQNTYLSCVDVELKLDDGDWIVRNSNGSLSRYDKSDFQNFFLKA